MKRILMVVTLVALTILAPSVLLAQSNPLIGTWKHKVDPTQSKYTRTLTYEAHGNGIKLTAEGTNEDGTHFTYTYTANFDGKDYPVAGTGVPGGADTIALKSIDRNTTDVTWKKAGKVLLTGQYVVSKDGKVINGTGKTTDANGKEVSGTFVWEKQ